jgi:hypothetical protein
MIHFYGIVILQSHAEVVHPALKVDTDFSVPPLHRDALRFSGPIDTGPIDIDIV